jgi:putative restriction endonuclease
VPIGDHACVLGWVAPTDYDWYRFLQGRPEITEVNFWTPGGTNFGAVPAGSPFFFKLKRQHNAICGFGLFARFARLPVWRAWDVFGTANGTRDEHEFLVRLDRLSAPARRQEGRNRVIGCIAVTEPVYFAPDEWVAIPSDWSPNIVRGRVQDLSTGEGHRIWNECLDRATGQPLAAAWVGDAVDARRTGTPTLVMPRLGQSSFRLAVLDAYGNQCAVTTEHSLPVIDAAHIRPWADGGEHRVSNGMPLRRDLHRLFDLGYVTVRPDMTFAVSGRLREEYANGRVYYELDGRQIRLPDDMQERPDPERLAWHEENVFLGA